MTELDLVARDAGGHGTEFVNSITVGRAVTSRLRVYGEFFSLVSPSPGFQWEGQADAGSTYALRENVQLDAGCNFGVTRAAPDFEAFVGLSLRR